MKLRALPILLALALLLTVPAFAETLGEPVDGCAAVLAEGLTLTETQFWTGKDLCTEHYLRLDPESAVRPAVVSGETLWQRLSLQSAADARSDAVLAGCNGGFFTVVTGEPVGLVISDGILRADDGGLEALGFLPEGGAIFGKPEVRLTLTDGEQTAAVTGLNHSAGGLTLYTGDCGEHFTVEFESCMALCAAEGELRLGAEAKLRVLELAEGPEPLRPDAGQALLLLPKTEGGTERLPEFIVPGATLTLNVSCAEGWERVSSAVGILYPLLREGEPVPELETFPAPRTAVGIRADGSLIFYTVDGRQSGYSVGTGLQGAALRLQELGCVTAGALDGGGSTRMAAQMPGDDFLSTVNRPSENRSVVNYILLETEPVPAGPAAILTLYPLHINALSGAEIPLSVRATDRAGQPAALPERLHYTVSGGVGRVKDGVFYAEGSGSGSIRVEAAGLPAAEIPVRVTASPDTLELYGEVYGKKTEKLTLEPGQEVDITVRATDRHVRLSAADTLYTWTLEPAGGTVDETGRIVPARASGTGLLRVTAGESFVEIPITVWTGVPFADVSVDDSAFAAVKYVYDHGIFRGVSDTEFDLSSELNRAMLVTVLWRMCGEPAAEAPAAFADVAAESWYGPAVAWAAEAGLVQGYSETEFGPEDPLTREQILTILHRWAGCPEAEAEALPETVSDYARDALSWALSTGLTEPDAAPGAPVCRAEAAEILMKWCILSEEAAEAEENFVGEAIDFNG